MRVLHTHALLAELLAGKVWSGQEMDYEQGLRSLYEFYELSNSLSSGTFGYVDNGCNITSIVRTNNKIFGGYLALPFGGQTSDPSVGPLPLVTFPSPSYHGKRRYLPLVVSQCDNSRGTGDQVWHSRCVRIQTLCRKG